VDLNKGVGTRSEVKGYLADISNRSVFAIAAIILVVVVVSVAVYYWFFSPVIVEGAVDHKAVTGTKDTTTYSILLNTDSGILVKDEDYQDWFSEVDRNAFVNSSLEDRMKTEYFEIYYLVSIRVSTGDPVNSLEEGETLAYFVSRDDFNRAKIGDGVRFEVERFQTATIKGLTVTG